MLSSRQMPPQQLFVSVEKHATLELQNMCNTPIKVSLYLVAAAGISSRLVQIIDTKLSKRFAASSLESE